MHNNTSFRILTHTKNKACVKTLMFPDYHKERTYQNSLDTKTHISSGLHSFLSSTTCLAPQVLRHRRGRPEPCSCVVADIGADAWSRLEAMAQVTETMATRSRLATAIKKDTHPNIGVDEFSRRRNVRISWCHWIFTCLNVLFWYGRVSIPACPKGIPLAPAGMACGSKGKSVIDKFPSFIKERHYHLPWKWNKVQKYFTKSE